MPFDPKIPRASESFAADPLTNYVGKELLLQAFTVRDAFTFKGQTAHLDCVDENGEKIALYTTSRVVIEQLEAIGDSLPQVISPQSEKGYHKIY